MKFETFVRKIYMYLSGTVSIFLVSAVSVVHAAAAGGAYDAGAGGRYDSVAGGSPTLLNPLGVTSFSALVEKLLNAAILIGIPIAVLFIVLAGFKFVFAQGNPDALKKARHNFLYTVIGIAIFVGASLIATVITKTLSELGVKGL